MSIMDARVKVNEVRTKIAEINVRVTVVKLLTSYQ